MSTTTPFPIVSVGAIAFLATALIGWKVAAPASPSAAATKRAASETKRAVRPGRVISAATAAAGKRMGSIRGETDREKRMLATLALANSLSPGDFAAWMDAGWFDLRGGPELMVFTKTLMERWEKEDPEGLLEWAAKRKNDAGDSLMRQWTQNEPRRLIEFYKTHRDDRAEVAQLAAIAGNAPDLTLERLREMAANGISMNATGGLSQLMMVLAAKSPDALAAIADSLPATVKFEAERALSKLRMDASFTEEIRHLWDRPDGWRIFSKLASDEVRTKLLGELANLPPEWRNQIGRDSYNMVSTSTAQQWWDADLEGAGFSARVSKDLRARALEKLAGANPEFAFQHLGELDLAPYQRQSFFSNLFRSGSDPARMRTLVERLPTEEERQFATRILDQVSPPENAGTVNTPEELWEKLDPDHGSMTTYISQIRYWDAEKLAALTAGFKALPDDRRQLAALALTGGNGYNPAPAGILGEAIRYLTENPPPQEDVKTGYDGLTAQSSRYAVQFSKKDPVAASAWVDSLADGPTKTWARKNVIANWSQYDPKAAARWEKSFTPADRDTIAKLPKLAR